VHQWIGAAGLLGYSAISRLARETEAILNERPLDQTQLRESLSNLAMAFNSPKDARDTPVPDALQRALEGKRIALLGLLPNEAQRLTVAIERATAMAVPFHYTDSPESDVGRSCNLAVVRVRPELGECLWLTPETAGRIPLVLIGSREHLLAHEQPLQELATEILLETCEPEEALLRLQLALQQRPVASAAPQAPAETPVARARVVLADDDPTVLALAGAAIRNFGMTCETAPDGARALDVIRRQRPHVVVLDVNMPNMDGFAVLSTIRAEEIPARVLLLTARQQESDVLRGFSLGADDYVVKPFSPLELVARLKRLLRR
jgi:CheY-like chemotaxis protein